MSLSTQGLAILVLAWIGVLHPEVLAPANHDYHFIQLVSTPAPVPHEPAPVRIIEPPVMAKLDSSKLKLPARITPRETPVVVTPAPPKIQAAANQPIPVPAAIPVVPRQLVKTNVFSTGSSATPTIARAPQQVQTGGFGDPNGVPAHENNGKPITIAQAGSFDMPSGAGYGNGTGGSKGARGVVASAGFGNGTAIGDGSGAANVTRGTVRQSGFGDSDPAPVAAKVKPAADIAVTTAPPEITSKPTPAYTEEARKLRIEGEVLLEVVFESSGKLHVVRVVRGLGHGLDETAKQAAEQIRFKPALRDGKPADSTAVLHIVFQLA